MRQLSPVLKSATATALTRPNLLWIVLLFLITVCVLLFVTGGTQSGIDFHVFYTSGLRFRASQQIYDLADRSMPFKYHPAWPVLFSVLTFLPEQHANA